MEQGIVKAGIVTAKPVPSYHLLHEKGIVLLQKIYSFLPPNLQF
jgi:hypothetical protein